MTGTYILTNNHHGDAGRIDCPDLDTGHATYARHLDTERVALRDAVRNPFGTYFFAALYDSGRQLSWHVRFLMPDGSWEEATKEAGDTEPSITWGHYRAREIEDRLGELADLMGQENSLNETAQYRTEYAALLEEYETVTGIIRSCSCGEADLGAEGHDPLPAPRHP